MIIASICNIGGKSQSGLLLLDEELSSCRAVKLPKEIPQTGYTGIALSDKELIIASQEGYLVVLDKRTLALKSMVPPRGPQDIHSMLIHDRKLFLVATGQNAVMVRSLEGGAVSGELVYWKMKEYSYGKDIDHINSICLHQGRILVSGFGPKASKLWASAGNGFVIDIISGSKVFRNLRQPHSLLSSGGSVLICESAKCRVVDLTKGKHAVLEGYSRGLCEGPQGLYAAVSRGRKVSKSTGLAMTNPQDEGISAGRSAIYLLDRASFRIKRVFEIGDFEFYDLARVPDTTDSWPLYDSPIFSNSSRMS